MNQKSYDPAHWREMAEECRKVAEQLDDASRKTMLEIAQRYEELATLVGKNVVAPTVETEG